MFADPWLEMGEIDIIEGVNQQSVNTMTLHTSARCVVENTTIFPGIQGNTNGQLAFSGQTTAMNCDVNAAGQGQNVGYSIQTPINSLSTSVASAGNLPGGSVLPTYGTNFSLADGGVYAMEWTTESISIWFFHHTGAIPNDVTSNTPNPSGWGTPLAKFAGSGCDFQTRFKDLKIVIDTTFCGAWAGKVWQLGGCAASTGSAICEAYVRGNPAAFSEAYREIAGLKWFQNPTANVKRDSNHAHRMPHQKGRLYRWWL